MSLPPTLPPGHTSSFRVICGILAASLLITWLVSLAGGIQSPLFVLYFFVVAGTFRFGSLGIRVYAASLCTALYLGLAWGEYAAGDITLAAAVGHALLITGMMALSFRFLDLVWKERRTWQKQNSRALRVAAIADLLNSGSGTAFERVKKVGRALSEEIERDGLRARIVLHNSDNRLLPPVGGEWSAHMPIESESRELGTLLIGHRRRRSLTGTDQFFFEMVARTLGVFLRRERMWEDFKAELRRLEASSLLNAAEEI